MESFNAIYCKGFFKPLGKVSVKENEKVILGVVRQKQGKVTKDTFGAVNVRDHTVVEGIIEETEHGEP